MKIGDLVFHFLVLAVICVCFVKMLGFFRLFIDKGKKGRAKRDYEGQEIPIHMWQSKDKDEE